jgi:hypothetical protein
VVNCTSFGLRAEGWAVELLLSAGYQVIRATEEEDKVHKVDFWIVWEERYLAIQFSIDKREVVGRKGLDALKRGIVPSWLNGQELERAFNGQPGIRPRLVEQFRRQVEEIVTVFPDFKLRRPAVPTLRGAAQLAEPKRYRSG